MSDKGARALPSYSTVRVESHSSTITLLLSGVQHAELIERVQQGGNDGQETSFDPSTSSESFTTGMKTSHLFFCLACWILLIASLRHSDIQDGQITAVDEAQRQKQITPRPPGLNLTLKARCIARLELIYQQLPIIL
jgi:hypothetical protein